MLGERPSQSAYSTCITACWMKRSSTVGIRAASCRPLPSVSDSPHRLRLVAAIKQLSPDRGPVFFQVGTKGLETHTLDARCSLVALNLRQCLTQIVSLDNRFH